MAQIDRITGLNAVKSDGTVAPYEPGVGATLASGSTYYFPFATKDGDINSAHLVWDANVILTSVVLEDTNLPAYYGQAGTAPETSDTSDYSSTKGAWIQENPTTSYISVTSSDGTTGGATVTGSTIAVAGGTAGGAMLNISGLASKRCRLHVVVGATGGVVRVHTHGKSSS